MSDTGNITSDPFLGQAARYYDWAWPGVSGSGTGTLVINLLCLDTTGTQVVGSPLILYNALPVGGAYTYFGKSAITPAGTTQLQLQAVYTGGGSPDTLTLSAPTCVQAVIPPPYFYEPLSGPPPPFPLDPNLATTYYVDASAFLGDMPLTLPPAVTWPGMRITVYREDANGGATVTVATDAPSGDQIYGSAALALFNVASIVLTNQGSSLTLESDGRVAGGHGSPPGGWWVQAYNP